MKLFIIFVFCLVPILHISGQQSYNITYNKPNEQISQLAGIMDVGYLSISVEGALKGKKIILKENIVEENSVSTKEAVKSYAAMGADNITISVMCRRMANDSIKIDVRSSDLFYYETFYQLPESKNHILMETKSTDRLEVNIPIFAYTTGISRKFNIGGEILEGIDYCELRDSNTLPVFWKEKYGIINYIYYTIDIE